VPLRAAASPPGSPRLTLRSVAADPKTFLRDWPSPFCNVSALLASLLAFILFCAALSAQHSHRVTVRLEAARPEGCPRSGLDASSAPAYGRERLAASSYAVAADEARCSAIGAAVLSENGTAVDAAVATALCLGVLHPHSSGIGGGAFIVIYRSSDAFSEVIDARETAPAAAFESMFVGAPAAALTGGAAVGVPGELAGLWLAWQRHGNLPWARLVAPAAALAEGFTVGEQLAVAIAANAAAIAQNAALSAVLMPRGAPLRAGERCANRALAATLRAVGTAGAPAGFYSGARGAALAADVAAAGGNFTPLDLASYVPIIRPPLRVATALGVTLLGAPPPSSGGAAVAFLANFLGGYPAPWAGIGTSLQAQRTAEAFKHAFAARMSLGDPFDPFVANNSEALALLTSRSFADALRAATLDNATQPAAAYGGILNPLSHPERVAAAGAGSSPADHGTTHLSIIDAHRNAVALTSTVNTAFGAKVMSAATGVILNNQLDDFSIPGVPNGYGLAPSRANFIKPGKRPLSSMSPTVVLDSQTGTLRAVVGASGGPRIITATAQALLRALALGADVADAVAAPRLHHQLLPAVAWAEETIDANGQRIAVPFATVAALRARGHTVNATDAGAVVQMIVVDGESGGLTACSDTRKGGAPAGA
jgi:gamma-glutamyltranspeptidase/glutathione hydrolase/leukotriene-C4 hydrolase